MADVRRRQSADHHDDPKEAVIDNPAATVWVAGTNVAALSLSRVVYSKRAVLAAAYKLSDRAAILVDEDGDRRWAVHILTAGATEAKSFLPQLIRELVDQALRAELERQFGDIRTMLVAQAFSEGNLLDPIRDDADPDADPRGIEQRR